MTSIRRVGELLKNVVGLFCVLGWLSLQAATQSAGASVQSNPAPSSDPTLTQTIRPDGSISSEWTNPDDTRFCHSEFVNLGNGKTRRVSTVFRKDGTIYYENTYTTNSDGSAVSEFIYPDSTHKTNGTAVTLTIGIDGSVSESSGSKSYAQPPTGRAISGTEQSASPQAAPATKPPNVTMSPARYTFTPSFGKLYLDLRYEPTTALEVNPSARPTGQLTFGKEVKEGFFKNDTFFVLSFEPDANRPLFSDPGAAIASSPDGKSFVHGIQLGYKFLYDVPFDSIATSNIRIQLPTLAPSAQATNEIKFKFNGITMDIPGTASGAPGHGSALPNPPPLPSPNFMGALNLNDVIQSLDFFNCPAGSGCVATPSLDLKVNYGSSGPIISSFGPGNLDASRIQRMRLDWLQLKRQQWEFIGQPIQSTEGTPNASVENPGATSPNNSAATGKDPKTLLRASYGRYSSMPSIHIGADGGSSFFNGNTPPTFNLHGAALWGKKFMVGPMGGYGQTSIAPAGSIGGHAAGQTFVDQTLRSHSGMFGAEFEADTWRVAKLEFGAGANVVGQTINNAAGFCGFGNATSPAGCHVFTTKTTHNTGIGSFVQGGVSFKVTHHLSLTTGLRYETQPSIKSPASSGSSIGVNRLTPFGGLEFNYNWSHTRQ